jgi:DNA-binding transcriptional regulator LsrR (DeoR family)
MVLFGKLESTEPRTIGIGSGRTMAAIARVLPPLRRPETSFVSLTGDFAALNDANPFEVVNTLVARTGGKGHAFTAPLIVESREDRDLFLRQRGVAHAMGLVHAADFLFTGLGHVGLNSFLDDDNLVTEQELAQIRALDVAADLAGHLLDANGEFIEEGLPERMLAVDRSELSAHPLIIAAGGAEKASAMLSALRSGCIDGVITNADVARKVIEGA